MGVAIRVVANGRCIWGVPEAGGKNRIVMDAEDQWQIVIVEKMAKTGKRIPISDAKEIGNKNGYTQVIIVAWDGETGTTSVCTWGKSMKDCEQAAEGGNFVKKAMGWPDELCKAKPARLKKKES